MDPDAPATFFYDLADPYCYLVAERIIATLGELETFAEWEPVHAAQLRIGPATVPEAQLAVTVQRAGLQPLRLPRVWPPDSELAMRVATFAKGGGKAVAFSLAAFRQAFAGGRDLTDENTILIAGAACEMHPTALRRGIELAGTRTALQHATRRAREAGPSTLPAIQVGSEVYAGLDAIHRATVAF